MQVHLKNVAKDLYDAPECVEINTPILEASLPELRLIQRVASREKIV